MQGWQKQYFSKPQPVVEHRVIVVWLWATKAFSYHMFLICFEAPHVPSRGDGKTCGAVLLPLLGYHCSGLKTEPCGSFGSTWQPHVTHTTLQFSKDKKALSATIETLTRWGVLSSSWSPQGLTEHYQNWHKKPHPSCKTAKKSLNCITVYVLSLSKSCFYLKDLGIYQSRGRAWAAQARPVLRVITQPCHCLLSKPLVHLAFCWYLLITCINDLFTIYTSQPHS